MSIFFVYLHATQNGRVKMCLCQSTPKQRKYTSDIFSWNLEKLYREGPYCLPLYAMVQCLMVA